MHLESGFWNCPLIVVSCIHAGKKINSQFCVFDSFIKNKQYSQVTVHNILKYRAVLLRPSPKLGVGTLKSVARKLMCIKKNK